ncbi:hypothetical protein BKA63DRAFT_288832 [Paraphoma chrysanthemicola]|nr:hypothetical protein BKA63DRAFT_288832 [Paraphoma chrysanthemicola]
MIKLDMCGIEQIYKTRRENRKKAPKEFDVKNAVVALGWHATAPVMPLGAGVVSLPKLVITSSDDCNTEANGHAHGPATLTSFLAETPVEAPVSERLHRLKMANSLPGCPSVESQARPATQEAISDQPRQSLSHSHERSRTSSLTNHSTYLGRRSPELSSSVSQQLLPHRSNRSRSEPTSPATGNPAGIDSSATDVALSHTTWGAANQFDSAHQIESMSSSARFEASSTANVESLNTSAVPEVFTGMGGEFSGYDSEGRRSEEIAPEAMVSRSNTSNDSSESSSAGLPPTWSTDHSTTGSTGTFSAQHLDP